MRTRSNLGLKMIQFYPLSVYLYLRTLITTNARSFHPRVLQHSFHRLRLTWCSRSYTHIRIHILPCHRFSPATYIQTSFNSGLSGARYPPSLPSPTVLFCFLLLVWYRGFSCLPYVYLMHRTNSTKSRPTCGPKLGARQWFELHCTCFVAGAGAHSAVHNSHAMPSATVVPSMPMATTQTLHIPGDVRYQVMVQYQTRGSGWSTDVFSTQLPMLL